MNFIFKFFSASFHFIVSMSLCPVYGKQIVGQVASHKGRMEFAAMLMSGMCFYLVDTWLTYVNFDFHFHPFIVSHLLH